MKLFHSGTGGKGLEYDDRLGLERTRYRLLSCHGAYERVAFDTSKEHVDNLRRAGVKFEVMYDSGAFTAWSRGAEVKLKDLVNVYGKLFDIVGKHAEAVWFINLDKIPGSRNQTRAPSPDEIRAALDESDRNYTVLTKHFGDRVLPVFHARENAERLLEVANMGQYMCAAPGQDRGNTLRVEWARTVFDDLRTRGKAAQHVHGLAATGWKMMFSVPWHSVDSATWIIIGANGGIFIDTRLRVMHMSAGSGKRHEFDRHFSSLSPYMKEQLEEQFRLRGFTSEELSAGSMQGHYSRINYCRIMLNEAALEASALERADSMPVPPSLFGLG